MKVEIIKTADNSNSLFVPDLDESYHSVNGAINESEHIFINLGLKSFKDKKKINIFEMGFGTGLNTYLTYLYSKENQINIKYDTCELFPLELDVVSKLNYPEQLNKDNKDFITLHKVAWNEQIKIDDNFILLKHDKKIQDIELNNKFDLIYYDAFSPSRQPELWSEEIFTKLRDCLFPNGVIVTYCAKNSFKKMLKSLGFEVESHPGPTGKREVTRALLQA
ncbi:tRNA (5-methylaminomethyl-2-thiouridine)(34)-methyltransferase MnmD [Bacteroidales bacterium OttesenSCG-928-K03]|nr:tRNA (5-methylaminomethyl-2-thiouridine)(34)-methyltransferase MnmD [Odoribacter sp. OttesenSCG-928-L07]MDL2239407.1 tRNA (5-methylaminomethyl-2-thiouridine)(34)-methyltransferase MnmD [Bacteroidales bacterium OttesenSCG-928-L14]MDL2240733.1 tRNA (5-methylaminomethyl-2-thiouridine)(34)-methyltransferase MnmD [Bacteroidales bacterium OttesenSCG-928-K22]MDL2242923.1 tRNA (5-methylaminomethyl-2-thiouridine)(34)-methyltransferase MnmD [Bacteroidales bacterium OttesenSCG-928-K03]